MVDIVRSEAKDPMTGRARRRGTYIDWETGRRERVNLRQLLRDVRRTT